MNSNQADLALIRSIPGYDKPRFTKPPKKITIRKVGLMVRAIIRMKAGAREWAKSKKIKNALEAKFAEMGKAKRLLAEKAVVEKKEVDRIAEDKELKRKVSTNVEKIRRKASLRMTTTTTRKTTESFSQKRKISTVGQ